MPRDSYRLCVLIQCIKHKKVKNANRIELRMSICVGWDGQQFGVYVAQNSFERGSTFVRFLIPHCTVDVDMASSHNLTLEYVLISTVFL